MATGLHVLLIEDDDASSGWMRHVLAARGFDVVTAPDGATATACCAARRPDVVVMDLRLPDIDGLELLAACKAEHPDVPVVMVTGHGSVKHAVEAMNRGALTFIEKPVELSVLVAVVDKAAEYARLRQENARLRQQVEHEQVRFGELVSQSPRMRQVVTLLEAVAPTSANVLIRGENGTGKELVANAIHRLSHRASGPLVKVNCAALPSELIESELFGHKRGSFTGAVADRQGLMVQAHGGTLMLDEIGEMPAALQAKLLRALQERKVTPVGGTQPIDVDFRLVCATNVDIDAAVATGKFREDLYFRINTVSVHLPALRERPEDIPMLAQHFLTTLAARYGRTVHGFTPAASAALLRHAWRGNVRELEHAVERAVIVSGGELIGDGDLPEQLRGARAASRGETTATVAIEGEGTPPLTTLDQLERWAIERTLRHTRGNKRAAASILGIHRPTLYQKLARYGLMPPNPWDPAPATAADRPGAGPARQG